MDDICTGYYQEINYDKGSGEPFVNTTTISTLTDISAVVGDGV
jgi:hypothetical protein